MRRIKKNLKFLPLILAFCTICVQAQSFERDVVSSNGDYISSGSISLEFTTGEAAIGMFSGTNFIISQGFNQADTGSSSQNINVSQIQSIPFVLYPNPGNSFLNVSCNQVSNFKVLDATCKEVLPQVSLMQKSIRIDVGSLAPGVYYIQANNAAGSSTKKWIKE